MSRAAHSTASSAEPELEQVEDGESDEDGRRDVPGSWAGYGWHLVKTAGYGAYSAAHYLGGKLAHLFGVTSPDWQFAIDIHEDMEQEAREEREEEERALRHLQERRAKRLRELESQKATALEE